MTKKSTEYNVALRYTEAALGYAGVITWTSFKSKAHFDKWFANMEPKDQEVVEEGITQERAVALCRGTPLASYATAAIEDATDPQTGEVNMGIANAKLSISLLARRMGV